jgi:WD40 repeat protein
MRNLGVYGTGIPGGIAWSLDGATIAVSTTRGVLLYDGINFHQNGFIEINDTVENIALSPDGSSIAIKVGDEVSIWDIHSASKLINLPGKWRYMSDLVFGSGGLVAALGMHDCDNYMVLLWDSSTGQQIYSSTIQRQLPYSNLDFSPDGSTLAYSGKEGIELLDTGTKEISLINIPNYDWETDFIFSSDGRRIFTSNGVVYDIENKTTSPFLADYDCSGYSFGFRKGINMAVAVCDNNQVIIFNLADGSIVQEIRLDISLNLAINPTGNIMIYTDKNKIHGFSYYYYDYYLNIYDIDTNKSIKSIAFDGYMSAAIGIGMLDGSEKYLSATLGPPGVIHIRDIESGSIVRTLQASEAHITDLAFSPDRYTLASIDLIGTLRLWDIDWGIQTHSFNLYNNVEGPIIFSPDGLHLASVNSAEPSHIMEVNLQTGSAEDKGFSPKGVNNLDFFYLSNDHLISWENIQGEQNTTTVNDLTSTSTLITLQYNGDIGYVYSIAISDDDKYLAAAFTNGAIQIWNMNDQKLLGTIDVPITSDECPGGDGGPDSTIARIFFSPNSYLLVSVGAWDRIDRLWNILTGSQILEMEKSWESPAFTPDGRYLVTTGDGFIRVWGL